MLEGSYEICEVIKPMHSNFAGEKKYVSMKKNKKQSNVKARGPQMK